MSDYIVSSQAALLTNICTRILDEHSALTKTQIIEMLNDAIDLLA